MATRLGLLDIKDLRGGRNGVDSPLELQPDQCVEAVNVDWYEGLIGRKRRGAVNVPMPGLTPTSHIVVLIRHLPGALETTSELWAIVNPWGFARLVGSTWAAVPGYTDLMQAPWVRGVSFNGKLFLAYPVADLNRLHVWDGTTLRRVGIMTPPQPSVTPAAGTGITGQRGHKVAYVTQSGAITRRRSELSLASATSISNAGGWVITHGMAVNEGETHWEVYAAAAPSPTWDAAPYYLLATLPMATASYTDTLPPVSFPALTMTLRAAIGAYTLPPAAKFLLVDEARLLLASCWSDPSVLSRVWWTPIVSDASGIGNDERIAIHLNPFIDFDPGDGGEITGLGGPLFDSPYVFKFDRIYKMVRTGLSDAPYRPVTVSKKCGALRQEVIVMGEDESGSECLYFLSRRGPYRLGVNGLQYCGRDIEDLWAKVLLSPEDQVVYGAHGIYHPDLHQVWWWVNTTPNVQPDLKLVFDVKQGRFTAIEGVRRGWAQHTGPSANAFSSVMYAEVLGSPNSLRLKPYIGAGAAMQLWRCDVTPHADAGTDYPSTIRTRAELPGQSVAEHGGVIEGHLVSRVPSADLPLRVTTIRDFGRERRDASALLTNPEMLPLVGTRLLTPLRDLAAVSAAAVQIEISDDGAAAAQVGWTLDELVLRIRREEDR